jgi:hypothetical protein
MALEEVGARLSFKDRRQFSADAAKARRDVKDIGDEADRSGRKADRASRGFVGLRSSFGALKVGAFAAVGAVGALGAAVGVLGGREALEAGAVTAQTNAVIASTKGVAKVTAAEVDKLAGAIGAYSGQDDEAIKSGANLLLTFTKIRNEVGKGNDIFNQATGALADVNQAMGQDSKASALLLGKALNDPIKGMGALGRAGVQFDAQQKKQIKGFVETGRILEAQKIILAEITTQFGGSAAAFGQTDAGRLARLKEGFLNLSGAIMGPLLRLTKGPMEAMISWASRVEEALPRIEAKAVAFFGNVGKQVPNLMGAFRAGDSQGIAEVIDNMLGNTGKLVGPIRAVADIGADLAAVISKGLAPAFADVASVMPAFLSPLKVARSVLGFVADNASTLRPIVTGLAAGFVTWKVATVGLTVVTKAGNAVRFVAVASTKGLAAAQAQAATSTGGLAAGTGVLNKVMAMNPILRVVTVLAALSTALVVAYKNSDGFRQGLTKAYRFVVDKFIVGLEWIVKAAAKAFGWVPGIGADLRRAAKDMERFRDDVNASLNGIVDKDVTIQFKAKYAGPPVPLGSKDGRPMIGPPVPVRSTKLVGPPVPGLHQGGVITRGGWAVTGERGPELGFWPTGSAVVPAQTTSIPERFAQLTMDPAPPPPTGTNELVINNVMEVDGEVLWRSTKRYARRDLARQ